MWVDESIYNSKASKSSIFKLMWHNNFFRKYNNAKKSSIFNKLRLIYIIYTMGHIIAS